MQEQDDSIEVDDIREEYLELEIMWMKFEDALDAFMEHAAIPITDRECYKRDWVTRTRQAA